MAIVTLPAARRAVSALTLVFLAIVAISVQASDIRHNNQDGLGRYRALTSSPNVDCALRQDGTVKCWGDVVPAMLPPAGATFVAIKVTGHLLCGVTTSGSLKCWGEVYPFNLGGPAGYEIPGAQRFTDLTFVEGTVCGLRNDGGVTCDNTVSSIPRFLFPAGSVTALQGACFLLLNGTIQCRVPVGYNGNSYGGLFASLAGTHVCGLQVNGKLRCFDGAQSHDDPFPAEVFSQVEGNPVSGATWCGLRPDDTVRCGRGWSPALGFEVPPAGGRYVEIAGTSSRYCGLAADGAVDCWGDLTYAGTQIPKMQFNQIASGGDSSCAIAPNGYGHCWGTGGGAGIVSPGAAITKVAMGNGALCMIRAADKQVICGFQNYLGFPQAETVSIAEADGTACTVGLNGEARCLRFTDDYSRAGPYKDIASIGYGSSCAILAAGAIQCFHQYGNLGAPSGTFSMIAAGLGHYCALATSGSVTCWGSNAQGQGTPPAGGMFSSIDAGGNHSCGVRTDGTVACWGSNSAGQTDVPPGLTASSVALGKDHTCAIKLDGEVVCWGAYDARVSNFPYGETFGTGAISAGAQHTCQRKPDGTLACWGSNEHGQATPPSGAFAGIGAGLGHNCARGGDGSTQCWGWDDFGQLATPTGAMGHIAVGGANACAFDSAGTPQCWGFDNFGQSTVPPAPAGLAYRSLDPAGFNTCGVFDNGTASCWGYAGSGINVVPAGVSWQAISVGEMHACGLKADGNIQCWGQDNTQQVGTSPTGLFKALEAGRYHTCAIRSDGTLACWGSNWFGETLPPSGTFVSVTSGDDHSCAIRNDGVRMCWGSVAQVPMIYPALLPAAELSSVYGQVLTLSLQSESSKTVVPAQRVGMGLTAFAVVAGKLPAGVILSADGRLSGKPKRAGVSRFTVEAEDENGYVSQRSYELTVQKRGRRK